MALEQGSFEEQGLAIPDKVVPPVGNTLSRRGTLRVAREIGHIVAGGMLKPSIGLDLPSIQSFLTHSEPQTHLVTSEAPGNDITSEADTMPDDLSKALRARTESTVHNLGSPETSKMAAKWAEHQLLRDIDGITGGLSPLEIRVLRSSYGFPDGKPISSEDLAKELNIGVEVVKTTEAQALAKLSRSK